MPEILSLSRAGEAEGLDTIRRLLKRGGVLGIPTDTVYGLATDPFSEKGVSRIFDLKGREGGKALPVLVTSSAHLPLLGVDADPRVLARLEEIWPAPLTAVLHVREPFAATGGRHTVAVRVPDHFDLQMLLLAAGPLTATSANRSGEPPARSAAEVVRIFGDDLDLVIDGGPSKTSLSSTLVDGTEWPPRTLREGPLVFVTSN